MVAQTKLDGNPARLDIHTTLETPPPSLGEIDAHAKSGWEFFTKFLFWNVVVIAVALIFVGLLTVWR